ncbi:MAG TPA: HPr family phosphocarrier protein [Planctomycetota bacterium]|nr:HPr family phosphocarrier protein [Planctomycetota bacterium]
MNEPSVRRVTRIVNKQGLHARPSTLIVRTAARFKAPLTITIRGETANARSIMEVMMLASPAGTEVLLEAAGEDAKACVDAVAEVFDAGFGEELAG